MLKNLVVSLRHSLVSILFKNDNSTAQHLPTGRLAAPNIFHFGPSDITVKEAQEILDKLTRKEWKLLELLAQGHTREQCAGKPYQKENGKLDKIPKKSRIGVIIGSNGEGPSSNSLHKKIGTKTDVDLIFKTAWLVLIANERLNNTTARHNEAPDKTAVIPPHQFENS